MLILGLSSLRHDPSAALIVDDTVTAAVENDKLSRSHTRGLPEVAIRFCLQSAGVGWHDIGAVAVAARPIAARPVQAWAYRAALQLRSALRAQIVSAYNEANDIGNFARESNDLAILRQQCPTTRFFVWEHHLCHAATAFFLSPFDRSLIITLDENGDGNSGMIAIGEGSQIRALHRIAFPHSIAWVYSQITDLIGFVPRREEHKTQWLSLESEAAFKSVFVKMLRKPGSPLPHIDLTYFTRRAGRVTFSRKFYDETGIDPTAALNESHRRELAASVQHACTDLVNGLVEHFCRQQAVATVCLAGGLFQNALLVANVERNLGINQVYVPPAPGNAGTAVGAGLLTWRSVNHESRPQPLFSVYSGPKFSRHEIKEVLDNSKARYSIENTQQRKIEAAVELLLAGKVIGWYQGATEFGPRALGNRSVLASPWAEYVRENLNDFIKKREGFRPFAIAIPEEDCDRYFKASWLCRFMNSLSYVRSSNDCAVPANFLLAGNWIRLHVVQRSANPLFWRLLKGFGEHAPAPMLVNTSFNLFGEPLVVTPRDAMRSFFCSGLDALIIDNFVLSKSIWRAQIDRTELTCSAPTKPESAPRSSEIIFSK